MCEGSPIHISVYWRKNNTN